MFFPSPRVPLVDTKSLTDTKKTATCRKLLKLAHWVFATFHSIGQRVRILHFPCKYKTPCFPLSNLRRQQNFDLKKTKMSQEQPQRPQEPIKYGDVFSVEGELAQKTVAPRDAAMMQTAENAMLGQIQKGAAASALQSAAERNEKRGFVEHHDLTENAGNQGVSITETDFPGRKIITEEIGGQVRSLLRL